MEALTYVGKDKDGKGTLWVQMKDDDGNEVLVGLGGGEVRLSYLDEELTWKELTRKKVGGETRPEQPVVKPSPPPPPPAAAAQPQPPAAPQTPLPRGLLQ